MEYTPKHIGAGAPTAEADTGWLNDLKWISHCSIFLKNALKKYDLQKANIIVAHNLNFDKHVVFHAFKWRLGINPESFWQHLTEFCSCIKAKDEMKLPALYPPYNVYRFPKLDELYIDTFKTQPPENAHDAKRDVKVLVDICMKRWLKDW